LLGAGALGSEFSRLAAFTLTSELDLVTRNFPLVDQFHIVAAEAQVSDERNRITGHFAFLKRHFVAARSSHASSESVATHFERKIRFRRIAATSGHHRGPLPADVRGRR